MNTKRICHLSWRGSPVLDGECRIGAGASRYLPSLLDGASPQRTALVLGRLPEQLRVVYQDEWQPAYSRLDLWGSTDRPSAS